MDIYSDPDPRTRTIGIRGDIECVAGPRDRSEGDTVLQAVA